MDNFAATLAALQNMKEEGAVTEYAVGGAMALVFWTEPTTTFDVDVFVLMPSTGIIVSLEPIYEWARRHDYSTEAEHIVIAGMPVQTIPAHSALAEEAVLKAAELDYEGQPVRVITPEYLIAMSLEGSARTQKRLARVAGLLDDENVVDRDLLAALLDRYGLQLPKQ